MQKPNLEVEDFRNWFKEIMSSPEYFHRQDRELNDLLTAIELTVIDERYRMNGGNSARRFLQLEHDDPELAKLYREIYKTYKKLE